MKVLVSVASRHGASFEIAEEISATLAAAGFGTAVLPPDAVTSLEGYDAVILGSSVYVGHWMDAAVNLVERFSKEITAVPVWLFSSGPMGHEPKPTTSRRTSPSWSRRRARASTGSSAARSTGPGSASARRSS